MWQIRKRDVEGAEEEQRQRSLEEHRLVTVGDAGAFAKRDKHTELKVELHQRLLDLINLQALEQMSREQIEDEVGEIVAEELAPHRLANLDNEGEVSPGRVKVTRVAAGEYVMLEETAALVRIKIAGQDLAGEMLLVRTSKEARSWQVTLR